MDMKFNLITPFYSALLLLSISIFSANALQLITLLRGIKKAINGFNKLLNTLPLIT